MIVYYLLEMFLRRDVMNLIKGNAVRGNYCRLIMALVAILLTGCVSFPSGSRSYASEEPYSSRMGKVHTTLTQLKIVRDKEYALKCEDAVYAYVYYSDKKDAMPEICSNTIMPRTRIVFDDIREECDYIQILPFPIVPILYRRYYEIAFYVEGEKRIHYHYYQQLPFDFYFHWPLDFSRLPFRLMETNR
jgi:hypothetical protein